MNEIRKEIMEEVYLTYLPADKFKTGELSIQMVTPLRKETAGLNAMLPAVLRRGTMRCPDMESLAAALDRLYGAQIDYTVRKKGENQCVGFVAGFIDDAYVPANEKLMEQVCRLMGELLLDPVTRNGRFLPAYVEGEKSNLIDAIRAIRNDKRDYADLRLLQEMCADEPYGVSRLGDEESAQHINNQKLYQHYQNLLTTSRVEVFYCGSCSWERVESAVLEALSALPRGVVEMPAVAQLSLPPEEPRLVTEEMDVTQGKLSMGFRCDNTDIPAMIMVNLLFGGSSNSKLFLNVREKLSLCYYASSSFHRVKGIMTVSSGIETKDYQKAYDEILKQLQAVQRGDWEEWEVPGALSTMINSLQSLSDTQGGLENFYLGQAATGQAEAPEDLAAQLRQVTEERIMASAGTVKLDTVYFLKGKEDVQ
ncbi:MAG: insulinase family protein [Clostridiales bacterium]|nr:insulinase family protein [Clostridiales bacterium]